MLVKTHIKTEAAEEFCLNARAGEHV